MVLWNAATGVCVCVCVSPVHTLLHHLILIGSDESWQTAGQQHPDQLKNTHARGHYHGKAFFQGFFAPSPNVIAN